MKGYLFKVDPVTGDRLIFNDFNNIGQGPAGSNSRQGSLLDTNGDILALDGSIGGNGGIFRIDPSTGTRTLELLFPGTLAGVLIDRPQDMVLD